MTQHDATSGSMGLRQRGAGLGALPFKAARPLYGPLRAAAAFASPITFGFTRSSAKGTERFLFQPEGSAVAQKMWRRQEPVFLSGGGRGGAPERATCDDRVFEGGTDA